VITDEMLTGGPTVFDVYDRQQKALGSGKGK
jgi:hypothetical protein